MFIFANCIYRETDMSAKKTIVALFFSVITLCASAQYYPQAETPNMRNIFPGPPSNYDTRFSVDVKHYFDGKLVQTGDPLRAEQIRSDAVYGTSNLASIYGGVLGFTVSSATTPGLWQMISQGTTTSAYASDKVKNFYVRMRPASRFYEAPYSTETLSEMRRTYSYPSSHTITGWATGMIVAAVAPHFQDTILARAREYGRSRVLGGMHWQSDVDDAYLIASVSVAHMLNTATFNTHLASTRNQINQTLLDSLGIEAPDYDDADYFSAANMPNAALYLAAPPEIGQNTPEFAHDMSQYLWGKNLRDSERGEKAKYDTSSDYDIMVYEFARAFGEPIEPDHTPKILELLETAAAISDNGCVSARDAYDRVRPYEFFHEEPFTVEAMPEESSFPSAHAARAWTTAMLLTAIKPAAQDTIMKVGYELGQSSVIAGISWQSDVDAARMVACATLSRMMSNPNMVALINEAKEEYVQVSHQLVTDSDDISIDYKPEDKGEKLYTIDGRTATSESRGILVGKGRKVVK